MITINIVALGKLKEDYLRRASEEYIKRLTPYCKLIINELTPVMLSDNPSENEIAAALFSEAKQIRSKLQNGFTISMCIEGKMLSSEKLSKRIFDLAANGVSTINIIIGSSFGLDESIKKQSDMMMSMSEMTFPHQLARVMLLEQIYRAFMIEKGTKYHK